MSLLPVSDLWWLTLELDTTKSYSNNTCTSWHLVTVFLVTPALVTWRISWPTFSGWTATRTRLSQIWLSSTMRIWKGLFPLLGSDAESELDKGILSRSKWFTLGKESSHQATSPHNRSYSSNFFRLVKMFWVQMMALTGICFRILMSWKKTRYDLNAKWFKPFTVTSEDLCKS